MIHTKPVLPAGHGEVVTRPAYEEWATLARANHVAADSWSCTVAGAPIADVRALGRREALAAGAEFSAKLGVAVAAPGDPDALIVATGHQPELYHPGVWVKDFLLQRLARETSASALDLVVDSDSFEVVGITSPCITPGVQRCRQYLAIGSADTCFALSPVPSERDLEDFCRAGGSMLASLPAPAIGHHFSAFCDCMRDAGGVADNLAEFVTISRRRYEAPVGTDYLELPLTHVASTRSFLTFVADLALDADRFAEAYNASLAEYRVVNKTRSAAQPFPDLAREDGRVELPFWLLGQGVRTAVWAERADGGGMRLSSASGAVIADLPADGGRAVDALVVSGALIAPKALALTLFARVFTCDLFIHGIGGGRYDRVTDGVCRRYYGIEPPAFVVASITMYLPLGGHIVSDEEIAAAKERLNRLEHNPDALLGELEFDSADEQARAVALASEKASLVAAISSPDADKKTLGIRIREVNTELSALMAPVRFEMESQLALLEAQLAASEILTDRTYPFCFWSPAEIADKVS